jgi:phosphoribosylaminoimidazolecarboxamide formyltransferase/IMP cyclohydrolase
MHSEKKYVLISVFNKSGIVEYARELGALGYTIVSSGGTAKELLANDVEVIDVATFTGMPAILDHRVVTLHPAVHAGLLAKDTPEHRAELESYNFPFYDLLVVDFYPLSAEIAKPDATFASIIEKIDIGGPTMVKAMAKALRPVVCNTEDRARVLEWLKAGQPDKETFIRALSAKAYMTIVHYYKDAAEYLGDGMYAVDTFQQSMQLCYGENASQSPAYLWKNYGLTTDPLALSEAIQLAGKVLSFNNAAEFDCGIQTLSHIAAGFEKNCNNVPYIAIGLKHGNVCGAAVGESQADVIRMMLEGNLLSIFGGSVMVNFPLTGELAETLLTVHVKEGKRLLDMIAAPEFSAEALEILGSRAKCRLMQLPGLATLSLDTHLRSRHVRGGKLTQPNYTYVMDLKDSESEMSGNFSDVTSRDAILAWAISATSVSNTITIVRDGKLLGNGVGQQDRVGAAELAIKRAIEGLSQVPTQEREHVITSLVGALASSDSFFPFPDGPQLLVDAGIKSIVTTSGSKGDAAVKELLQKENVSFWMIPDSIGRGFYRH